MLVLVHWLLPWQRARLAVILRSDRREWRPERDSASDHPVLPAFPEGRYLKFLLFDL